jgi:membrane-bound ClpP family serine protease
VEVVIITLLAFALLFLILEMLMPGFGICGIIGLSLLAIGAALTATFIPFGGILVVFELLLVAAISLACIKFLFRRQKSSKLVLNDTLNLDKADIDDLSYLFGKTGVTATALKPEGRAEFEGVSLEVSSSNSLFVPPNKRVQVISVVGAKVLVKEVLPNSN